MARFKEVRAYLRELRRVYIPDPRRKKVDITVEWPEDASIPVSNSRFAQEVEERYTQETEELAKKLKLQIGHK